MELTLILYLVSIALLVFLAIINRKNFSEAIKGPDGRWDLQDVVKLIWLILFPIAFLSALFLGLVVQPLVWYSLDTIFFILIVSDGGKAYIAHLGKNKNNETKPNTPPSSSTH